MFWAAFAYGARTALVPMNGDPQAPKGGVSARSYYVVLSEHLPTILNENSIFMHDNAPIHTAGLIKGLFEEMGVKVMDQPPYSPDLNPIENLQSILKQHIYRKHPKLEHVRNIVQTLEDLIKAAMDVWDEIRNEILYSLSNSMPRRVQAVIKGEGWYTDY